MRKGRSSRRSRTSRPLIGVTKVVEMTDSVGPGSSPRVTPEPPESTETPPPSVVETKAESKPEPKFAKTMMQGSVRTATQALAEAKAPSVPPPPLTQTLKLEPPPKKKLSSRPPPPAVATTAPIVPAPIVPVAPLAEEEEEEVDEDFFANSERHLVGIGLGPENDALTVPDKAKRKSDPVVVERRAKLARYVKWAVGGAGILCLIAVGASMVPSKKAAAPAPAPVTAKAAEPAIAPDPAPSAEATPPPATSAAPSAEPAATAPPPTEPAASASAAPSAAAAPAEEVTGDAKEEKIKARKALERRKLDEAIAAGEKSVKLDPTDGEAWLLLGASYQDKGNLPEARRAYSSCVKEATSGPKNECAKMLRF